MMNALLNRYKRRPAVGSNIGTTGSKNSSSNTGNTKSADSVAPVGNIFTKFRNAHVHDCKVCPRNNSMKQNSFCLGLLFIIIDDFPHESIWRAWLSNCNNSDSNSNNEKNSESCKVKILIHAKHPEKVTSPWVRDKLVRSFQYKPVWGSIDITRVMIGLMQETTTTYPEVDKVVFVSESCIPAVTLPACMSLLGCDSNSWLNYTNESDNGFTYQKQFEPVIKKGFPADSLYKADQWCALSRPHMIDILACPSELYPTTAVKLSSGGIKSGYIQDMIDTRLLDDQFASAHATDETFMASCLRLCGHITDSRKHISSISGTNPAPATAASAATPATTTTASVSVSVSSYSGAHTTSTPILCTSGVVRKTISFVRWSREENNEMLTGSPACFNRLDEELLREIRLCNHPRARLGRMGWGTASDKDPSHTRYNNPELAKLKKDQSLNELRYSALFVRKMKPTCDEEREHLFEDWLRLVLYAASNVMKSSSNVLSQCGADGNVNSSGVLTDNIGKKRRFDEAT